MPQGRYNRKKIAKAGRDGGGGQGTRALPSPVTVQVENMGLTKIEAGKYLAQCRVCGAWQEVHPQVTRADWFFEFLEAEFLCCSTNQSAIFTLEKETTDFH